MGTIMTAVAVFETHMVIRPVATMRPSTSLFGVVPTASTVTRAMRRCRFQRWMASARKKPPMNMKMVPLA